MAQAASPEHFMRRKLKMGMMGVLKSRRAVFLLFDAE